MVSIDLLRQVRMLRGLTQEELEAFAEIAGVWECPKGQVIFKEEDDSDNLYIVQSGSTSMHISSGMLANHVIGTIQPGDVFGELGFIDRKPRSATVRCVEYTILLSITREDFRRLGESFPNIERLVYKNLARIVAERLRKANEQLKELAGRDRTIAVSFPQYFMV
jgi:CRP-like cAMP-binding protein